MAAPTIEVAVPYHSHQVSERTSDDTNRPGLTGRQLGLHPASLTLRPRELESVQSLSEWANTNGEPRSLKQQIVLLFCLIEHC